MCNASIHEATKKQKKRCENLYLFIPFGINPQIWKFCVLSNNQIIKIQLSLHHSPSLLPPGQETMICMTFIKPLILQREGLSPETIWKDGRSLSLTPSCFPQCSISVGDLVSKVSPNSCVLHWVKIHKTSTVTQLFLSGRPWVRTGGLIRKSLKMGFRSKDPKSIF